MPALMEQLVADLGEKCERRAQGLLIAIDALEKIQHLLASKRKMEEKQKLLAILCEETLANIEVAIENNGNGEAQDGEL